MRIDVRNVRASLPAPEPESLTWQGPSNFVTTRAKTKPPVDNPNGLERGMRQCHGSGQKPLRPRGGSHGAVKGASWPPWRRHTGSLESRPRARRSSKGGGAETGNLETDLGKLVRGAAEAADEQRVGRAILIDEAQDLTPDELAAVCATAQSVGQRDHACLFALAGLPSLPRVLAAAKSYSDAAVYVRIDLAAARLRAAQGLPAPESLLSPRAVWPTSYRDNPPTPSPGRPPNRKPTQSLSMLPSRPPTTPAPATFPTLPLSAPAPMTS